jgi:hypothetical protein
MKKPEEMTIEELRGELRRVGMTDRLIALAAKEMKEAEQRAVTAKRDPLRAQLYVLKAYGMTNPDLSVNRKGVLFVTLSTLEDMQQTAA